MAYITVDTEVEINTDEIIDNIDTQDLLDELKTRGYSIARGTEEVDGDIYEYEGGSLRRSTPQTTFIVSRDADRHELFDHLLAITELNHYASIDQVLEVLKDKLTQ